MNLDKFNINNCNELISIENINIDTQEFYKIIKIVKLSLRKIGVNPNGLQLYYQRNLDATSILAIQVTHGDNCDIKNYMLNGCKSWKQDSSINCDIYIHSDAKSAQKSMKLSNLISRDIIDFFEKSEKMLLKNNNFDLPLSFMIPLDIKKEKEENSIKKLIKKILK